MLPELVKAILRCLEVTIGIFNLIMAVFIDNVTDGSTKKRQRELGENAPKTEYVSRSTVLTASERVLGFIGANPEVFVTLSRWSELKSLGL